MGLAVAIVAILVLLSLLGLLGTKASQLLAIMCAGAIYFGWAVWNAMSLEVRCPRCGWNIFYKYGSRFPAHVVGFPAQCPKCDFDLEQTPPGDG